MGRGEKLAAVMKRNIVTAPNKTTGKLTNDVTIKAYKKNIDKFLDWSAEKGITREGHLAQNGYSAQSLLQTYADDLTAKGYTPQTVHTYLAPCCKGLGVGMHEISKPVRSSAVIVKNTLQHQNEIGERQAASPRYARITRFAEVVTVRPQAMVRLTQQNLVIDKNGDTLIQVRDKGGKISQQLILPHEVQFVRDMLSHGADGHALAPNERPFSKTDLGKIAYSGYRCARAQEIEKHFEQRFNAWKTMPSRTPADRQARAAAKKTAQAEKAKWVDKICNKYNENRPNASAAQQAAYRKRLENPSRIAIRGGNLERAKELGRPTDYDRVAVRIASVYALSHWEDESTLRNYLTK